MPRKKLKARIITAEVWLEVDGELFKMRKHKIKLITEDRGVIVKDGRPVVKEKGRWVYHVI